MSKLFFAALGIGLICSSWPDQAQAQRRRGGQQARPGSENESQTPMRGSRGGRFDQANPDGQVPAMGRRGHGHGGGQRPTPLFTALDTNKDGKLSRAELSAAADVIKSLDKDQDGMLSLAECAPTGGHGHGHGGARPTPEEEAQDNVETLMAFDKNGDQRLTAEELPERLSDLIQKADSNGDGQLTKQELTTMAQKKAVVQQPMGRGGLGRGRGRFAPQNRPSE